jgi:hypothetical protein
MLVKKVLIVFCAAGILAIGACFLPPPLPPQLPPPPLPHRDLQGIHRIRVVVEDRSPSRHLDALTLADAVTEGINLRSRNSKVKASVYQGFRLPDAVLKITIFSQSAVAKPSPQLTGLENWPIHIDYSTTLTRPDGQILWQEDHFVTRLSRSLRARGSDPAGSEPRVQYMTMSDLGSDLALRIFYVN